MAGSSSIRVSVVPPASDLGDNALFKNIRHSRGAHSPNVHWLDIYTALHEQAARQDILLDTADILPAEKAHILFYMPQPGSPDEIPRLKQSAPHLKAILVLLETSLGARYMMNPRNHRGFDAVLTYNERLVDNRKYFPMRTRAYNRDRIRTGLDFEHRKTAFLVGTNRKMRWRSGLGAIAKGWRYSPLDWFDYVFCPGHLIDYRAQIGRLCANYPSGTFDLFGEGWEIDAEAGARSLGVPQVSTLEYTGNYRFSFALENHSAENSLISERIWDALWGDTVPVYRGNTHLSRHVPKECFVDSREFRDPEDLFEFLVRMPKDVWEKYRRAGRDFIMGERIEAYLPQARAAEMLTPIARMADALRSAAGGRP